MKAFAFLWLLLHLASTTLEQELCCLQVLFKSPHLADQQRFHGSSTANWPPSISLSLSLPEMKLFAAEITSSLAWSTFSAKLAKHWHKAQSTKSLKVEQTPPTEPLQEILAWPAERAQSGSGKDRNVLFGRFLILMSQCGSPKFFRLARNFKERPKCVSSG